VHVRCNRVRCVAARVSVPGGQGRPHALFLSSPAAILSAGAAARTHETRRIRQISGMTGRASCDEGPPRPASVPAGSVLTFAASLGSI
jgi:hypothetical protein